MPLRAVNDTIQVSDALTQLATVMIANTALQAAGGPTFVNDATGLYEADVIWPALLLEEDQVIEVRPGIRTWKKSALAVCTYMDCYAQKNQTIDTAWNLVDLDVRRMVANIEDSPTISVGGIVYIERIVRVTFSPYGEKVVDHETFSVPVVQRQIVVEFELPAYVSAY